MGIEFRIEEGVGPIVEKPIRSLEDTNRLRKAEPKDDVDFVYDGIDATISKLEHAIPLIGFSGAPFTLAGALLILAAIALAWRIGDRCENATAS